MLISGLIKESQILQTCGLHELLAHQTIQLPFFPEGFHMTSPKFKLRNIQFLGVSTLQHLKTFIQT